MTITEDKAKKIISERNGLFNMVTEFPKAFLFWKSDGEESIGGPDTPAAVLKDDGSVVSMPMFVSMGLYDNDHIVSEHPVSL